MDGIVLWADPKTHKAVIWCSDHGDLAYASGTDVVRGTSSMPEAGTMVSFEAHEENGVRTCYYLTPIHRHAAPDLARALRELASDGVA